MRPVYPVAAPHSCKYTEEGSVAYYVMQHIAQVDRRMKMLEDVEITLTAADKAKWTADAKEYYMAQLDEANAQRKDGEDEVKPDTSKLPPPPATY